MPTADLDALLSGEDTATDPSQDPKQTDPNQGKSEEEIEFGKLSGSTQDRIRSLLKRTKEAEEEAERFKTLAYRGTQTPPPPPVEPNLDTQNAVATLKKVTNFATLDEVKQFLSQQRQQESLEARYRYLEDSESGEDGRPRFDRYEVQDYIKNHPEFAGYDPADVWAKMYNKELLDWEFKQRQAGNFTTPSLKSSRTQQEADVWTPEYIDQKIKEDPSFYEKNFAKINKVLASSLGN